MTENRINSRMTVLEASRALSGGKLRSYAICLMLLRLGSRIDPDASVGGFHNIMDLDRLGIYDDRIWMFFEYVCKSDFGKMVAVLRAEQLGQLAGVTVESLGDAIDNHGEGIDIDAVVEAVEKELPNFNVDAGSVN